MKVNKNLPRRLVMVLAAVLCFSVLSAPTLAQSDEFKGSAAGSAPIEEAVAPQTDAAVAQETPTPLLALEPTEAAVPLTPEGNLTVVDDLKNEQADDKQFITVKTKAGNTFYLIIDRAGKENNVYFLNLVDEADLMALMEEDGKLEPLPGEGAVPITPEPEPEPSLEPEPEVAPEPEKGMNPVPVVMAILVLLGGAGLWFFKLRKSKAGIKGSTHLDEYTFDEDDDYDEVLLNEDDQDSLEPGRDEE
jgi:hypothetical protein